MAYVVSHPIQYQAPLLRRIAREPGIDLTVFYGSDFSLRAYRDEGFGVAVEWDVPLLGGYKHEFLPSLRDRGEAGVFSPLSYGFVSRLRGFDAVWVHGYSTANAVYAMVAAKALGIPVLLRTDGWLGDRERGLWKLRAKAVYFQALRGLVDAVLPVGRLNAAYWRACFGDGVPQFFMPYAVDNAYFQERSRGGRARLQAELGLDPRRPVILFASKLQARKNCGHLIEAYARLAREGAEPEAYLLIVGDGEERVSLEAQARATGFGSIRFCGFRNQTELPGFFDLCTVFVLPARHEPWGLVVNEAMNAGRPAIVTDEVGCQPDLVRDGVEGYVYRAGDVDALAMALRRMITMPESAAAMGRRALERIGAWSFEEDVDGLRRALAHATRKIRTTHEQAGNEAGMVERR